MKRKFNKILCIMFALLLGVSQCVVAFAGGVDPVTITPEACVKVTGNAPETSEDFLIVFKADGSDISENYTVNGEGTVKLTPLTFEKPGIYNYTITQQKGTNSNCSYDESVYRLKITVLYSEAPYRLIINAALRKDGVDGKSDSITFENNYKKAKCNIPFIPIIPIVPIIPIIPIIPILPIKIKDNGKDNPSEDKGNNSSNQNNDNSESSTSDEKVEDSKLPFTGSDVKSTLAALISFISALIVMILQIKKISKKKNGKKSKKNKKK